MATAALKGSASLTPDGGSAHTLAVPLRDFEVIDRQPRHEWESADLSARNIVTIGDGVRDLWATIRFENEPGALKTLLRSAIYEDTTVTYQEESGGATFDCKVIATASGDVALQPDRDRYGFGEYEARIHLRRVDGGTFDDLL